MLAGTPGAGSRVTPVRRSVRLSEVALPSGLLDHDLVVARLSDVPRLPDLIYTPNPALQPQVRHRTTGR